MNLLARPLHAAAALLLVVAVAEVGRLHLLEGIEGRVSDFFVRHHAGGLAPDPDIVIVDIDEPRTMMRMPTRICPARVPRTTIKAWSMRKARRMSSWEAT